MTRIKLKQPTPIKPLSETEEICSRIAMLSDIPDAEERSRLLQDYIRLLLEPPKVRGRLANAATRRRQIIADIEMGEAIDRLMARYQLGLYKACDKLAECRELEGDAVSGFRKAYYRYRNSPWYRKGLRHWIPPLSSKVQP